MFGAPTVFAVFRKTILTPASDWRPIIAAFHSSPHVRETARKREARVQKKRNTDKLSAKEKEMERTRPDPVLGIAAGDDAKWEQCDLAKILLREEDIAAGPIPSLDGEEIDLPQHYNFGVGATDERFLFESLPFVAAQRGFLQDSDGALFGGKPEGREALENRIDKEQRAEKGKARMLARLVDLRNANARGIAFENRRRCVEAFSAPGKPNDTGRPEVQAAILTARIRNLWSHLQAHKRDVHNRRQLRALVHQRARMLKYLERIDPDRFDTVLPRLGIDARAVRGEIQI